MKKFEGLLFVTDLDGTLIGNDGTISKENLDAIEYFKAEGGIFSFITGRLPFGARHIYEIVKPNAPCGCINGGGIYDYEKEEFLWQKELPKSALDLVEYVDVNLPPMGIEVNLHEKIYFCKKNASTENHRLTEKFPDLTCHYRDVKEPIAKILFADENEENIITLMEMLEHHPRTEEFDFIRSHKEYYEILPKGISKGNLVIRLADILNIDIKKTIAAGDNDNDVSMLERAYIGVAVANASDNAKTAADYITVSNDENAIAKIIGDIENGSIIV